MDFILARKINEKQFQGNCRIKWRKNLINRKHDNVTITLIILVKYQNARTWYGTVYMTFLLSVSPFIHFQNQWQPISMLQKSYHMKIKVFYKLLLLITGSSFEMSFYKWFFIYKFLKWLWVRLGSITKHPEIERWLGRKFFTCTGGWAVFK